MSTKWLYHKKKQAATYVWSRIPRILPPNHVTLHVQSNSPIRRWNSYKFYVTWSFILIIFEIPWREIFIVFLDSVLGCSLSTSSTTALIQNSNISGQPRHSLPSITFNYEFVLIFQLNKTSRLDSSVFLYRCLSQIGSSHAWAMTRIRTGEANTTGSARGPPILPIH